MDGFWVPGVREWLGRSEANAWVVVRTRNRVTRSKFIFSLGIVTPIKVLKVVGSSKELDSTG